MEKVSIPIRRQTYDNLEQVRDTNIFSTPVRPKKNQVCPDAPQRKTNVFNYQNTISNFSKLKLEG